MLHPKERGSLMDKKTRHVYTHIQPPRDPSQIERCTQTKSKGFGKRYFMQIQKKKKAGVAILISDKIDLKTKAIVRDKEGYYRMEKETIQQEDITLAIIYTPNIGVPKYVKQILMHTHKWRDQQKYSHNWGF